MNLKGITKEAVIGVALLVLALVNAILQMFGVNVLPITDAQVSEIISTLFLIITALYNTYKNRNTTKASQVAQTVTDAIKNGEIIAEDIEKIIKDLKDRD